MKTLKFLLEKEFRQIFRDSAILKIMFVMPVMQLLILPLAANFEVKNINLTVVDHDYSDYSRQLINNVTASGYFRLVSYESSFKNAMPLFESDESDIILEIPQNFEKDLIKEKSASLFMAVNAINGTKANIGASYLNKIIGSYNQEIRMQLLQLPKFNLQPQVETTFTNWYNIHMNYKQFMVPGILVLLLTLIGMFLSALNIVREKEIGTIEQINVTPIKKHHFILGKLIPFWIMGQIVLSLGLFIAYLFYNIIPAGNIGVMYVFSSVYLLAVLGLGLLVSTIANTQQQAMLISFFMVMVFILLGGLFTSINSMPKWAQVLTWFNPVSYFIEVMRMIILKGSGMKDISRHLFIMILFAIASNTVAVLNYRKRS